MEEINELNIPSHKGLIKPSEESTRKWLDGMERCWQEFLSLHREGYIPHITDKDIQDFLNNDSPVK